MPARQHLDPVTPAFLVRGLESDVRVMEGRRALCALCREAELKRYLMQLRVLLRKAKWSGPRPA